MNGRQKSVERTIESMVVTAVAPWKSVYRDEPAKKYTQDSQETIDFCLNHCPYANTECCNCVSGKEEKQNRGRPQSADLDELSRMLKLKYTNAEICSALGVTRMTIYRYKKKLGVI